MAESGQQQEQSSWNSLTNWDAIFDRGLCPFIKWLLGQDYRPQKRHEKSNFKTFDNSFKKL